MTTITPTGPSTESIEVVSVAPVPRPQRVSLADRIRMRAGLTLLLAGDRRAPRSATRRSESDHRIVHPGRPGVELGRPFS